MANAPQPPRRNRFRRVLIIAVLFSCSCFVLWAMLDPNIRAQVSATQTARAALPTLAAVRITNTPTPLPATASPSPELPTPTVQPSNTSRPAPALASNTPANQAAPTENEMTQVFHIVETAEAQAAPLREAYARIPLITSVERAAAASFTNDYFSVEAAVEGSQTTLDDLLEETLRIFPQTTELRVEIRGDGLWISYLWQESTNEWTGLDLNTGQLIEPFPAASLAPSDDGNNQSSVASVRPVSETTYYVQASANLRACTNTDCAIIAASLPAGTALSVDGEVDGEAAGNVGTRWYRVIYNGQEAYVYSGLVSLNAPAPPIVDNGSGSQLNTSQPVTTAPAAPAFQCDCSRTCTSMTCEEAYFQLNQCGCRQRDNDDDGRPCESQCG
jgi:hypothetical protein